jgi:hypothetical protein
LTISKFLDGVKQTDLAAVRAIQLGTYLAYKMDKYGVGEWAASMACQSLYSLEMVYVQNIFKRRNDRERRSVGLTLRQLTGRMALEVWFKE